MAPLVDDLDLAALSLAPGAGRRLELATRVDPVELGGERYRFAPDPVELSLEVSRMTGGGYALHLRLDARVEGPCMRCLEAAAPALGVDAREVDRPGGGAELDSPYVAGEQLDVKGWVRDALALALPTQVVCSDDCRGLCPVCAVNLNAAGEGHRHERELDPRWAKLRDLRLS